MTLTQAKAVRPSIRAIKKVFIDAGFEQYEKSSYRTWIRTDGLNETKVTVCQGLNGYWYDITSQIRCHDLDTLRKAVGV